MDTEDVTHYPSPSVFHYPSHYPSHYPLTITLTYIFTEVFPEVFPEVFSSSSVIIIGEGRGGGPSICGLHPIPFPFPVMVVLRGQIPQFPL